jgi:tungstate transport system substrate-binding protein
MIPSRPSHTDRITLGRAESRRPERPRRAPRGRRGRGIASSLAFSLAFLLLFIVAPPLFAADGAGEERSMILATTTSVRDSGLLDALLPEFSETTGIQVRVIAVGTGAALRMGREGNADLLLTHAPPAEQALVDDGVVTRRTPFMENFFVIAGPKLDPAKIGETDSPEQAIARIASEKGRWVSRSDDSGTHKKEKELFRAAGLDPEEDWPGLDRTGSGMGLSLQVAGERRAYILSDIGTFLAFQGRTGLEILSKPAPTLRNVYSLLELDGKRFERPLHLEEANALVRYLTRDDVQTRIGEFGQSRFGQPLFTPLRPKPEETRGPDRGD